MKLFIKILQVITILCFVGVIITPMANEQLNFIDEIAGNENRKKAKEPVLDITKLDGYTKDYDNYYTDNFNLRNNLVSIKSKLDFSIFKISPVPNRVTFGKDGWFYATKSAANYKGVNQFSETELELLKMELEMRTKWANERGIQYYVCIIPSKMNIYPEHLPNQIVKVSNSTRYDQVIALDNYSDINIVDIRKNLLLHKDGEHQLYWSTDDHWNELGAYYGYQEIMNRLNTVIPELSPKPLCDYKIVSKVKSGNLAKLVNANIEYPENYIELIDLAPINATDAELRGYGKSFSIQTSIGEIIKVNNKGNGMKCLIIRDSFGFFLVRFFQEHFSETLILHDGWQYEMHEDILNIEKPDIILNIILETEINKLLNNTFIQTADRYYKITTTNPAKIEEVKKTSLAQNLSFNEIAKITTLWLYNNHKSNGGKVKETLFYYELLYEIDKNYKKQTELHSSTKGISFKQAVNELSKQAYNEMLNNEMK